MGSQNVKVQFNRTDTNGALESGIVSRYYGNAKKITNNGKIVFYQILEGFNTLPFKSQTAGFSINMKHSSTATFNCGFLQLNSSGTIDTIPNPIVPTTWGANTVDPTWGSNIALVGSKVACSLTTTWTNFTGTASWPSNAKNLIFAIWSDSQMTANDIVSWMQAQVFLGSTAPTWSPRLIGAEQELVERYYQKSYAIDTAPATSSASPFVEIN